MSRSIVARIPRLRSAWVLVLCSVVSLGAASTPLLEAVKKGDLAAVRELLRQRGDVNVNVADVDGTSALHWAVHRDDLEAAKLLIAIPEGVAGLPVGLRELPFVDLPAWGRIARM